MYGAVTSYAGEMCAVIRLNYPKNNQLKTCERAFLLRGQCMLGHPK